jgi:hypothetical protein
MTAEETVQTWLVERSYGADEDLVTLVYATPDGTQQLRKQLSHRMLLNKDITAAREVPPERLESVPDDETRARYRDEATTVAEDYDPDDPI